MLCTTAVVARECDGRAALTSRRVSITVPKATLWCYIEAIVRPAAHAELFDVSEDRHLFLGFFFRLSGDLGTAELCENVSSFTSSHN